ncbi:hypothetical protein PN36_07600 [Candidatus Thiomargarita nelsonii]|uniref:Uncharacterized protein n=1 Tax=Candidatus Thiomargarita nelsonii TaxID=1003181 RepID=A0A0A6RR28_9GAMM|nr:hypothetical protein PN36_07600 [Candidatus Thiomargarita nelsonii]
MLSKQELKDWLQRFKAWLQEKMGNFLAFFWPRMARWTTKVATFSQRKAGELNGLPNLQPRVSDEQTVPTSVIKAWHKEIRHSHKILLDNQKTLLEEILRTREILLENQPPVNDNEVRVPPIEDRMTVELSNELRIYLERHNLFDEKLWLALWRGDPSPCELAKRLLLEYQPLKIENYKELAAWLEKASGNQKGYFIIPTLNHECDSNLHETVEQRMVRGAINRVLEIKRLGLGCDEGVVLKAQVVSS